MYIPCLFYRPSKGNHLQCGPSSPPVVPKVCAQGVENIGCTCTYISHEHWTTLVAWYVLVMVKLTWKNYCCQNYDWLTAIPLPRGSRMCLNVKVRGHWFQCLSRDPWDLYWKEPHISNPSLSVQLRDRLNYPKSISDEPRHLSSSADYFPFPTSSTPEVVSSVWEAAGGGRGADQCSLLSRSIQWCLALCLCGCPPGWANSSLTHSYRFYTIWLSSSLHVHASSYYNNLTTNFTVWVH